MNENRAKDFKIWLAEKERKHEKYEEEKEKKEPNKDHWTPDSTV